MPKKTRLYQRKFACSIAQGQKDFLKELRKLFSFLGDQDVFSIMKSRNLWLKFSKKVSTLNSVFRPFS